MRGRAHISVILGEDAQPRCCTYEDGIPPILDVSTASVYLTVSVPARHAVTESDVAAARCLLVAVRQYAVEMEQARIEQRAHSGAEAVA